MKLKNYLLASTALVAFSFYDRLYGRRSNL